jgi:hypothetical protein
MYVEQFTLSIIEIVVVGVLGAIGTPSLIYVLSQNADRKKELRAAFDSINTRHDDDQRHFNDAMGELRDRTTKLQTTVEIKKETVDKVQTEQIQAGVRIAVVEASIRAMTESQSRSEQNWIKVSDKLEVLGRIEETVKNLAEDMREVRAEQARKSE